MLFCEYVEKWKSDCRGVTSPQYHQDQDRMLKLHILPILGQKNFFSISAADVSEVFNASRAKGHAEATQLYIYNLVHKIFSDAIEFHELPVKNPVKRKHHKPKLPKKVAPFMHPDQSIVTLEYVMGSLFERMVWIELFTGIRVCETIPLRWKHIDFKNSMIIIDTIYIRKTGETQPYTKNGSQVYVPMPPRLAEFLLPFKGEPDDLVSPNTKGGLICYYVYRRYLRKISDKLGLAVRSSHGLRHSCTELWYEAGASTEDIRRLLNHNSIESTKKYIHRTDRRLAFLSKNVGKSFDSSCIVPEKQVVNE